MMMSGSGMGPSSQSPAGTPPVGAGPPPPYPGYSSSPASVHSVHSVHAAASPGFPSSSGAAGPLPGPPGGKMGPVGAVGPSSLYSDPEEKQRHRFQVELEFVQCLGNPNYLHFLAQRGYFKDEKFVNYLDYLQYWKEPKYVKYIKYPVCLHFLELLQHEAFRKEIVNGQCAKFLDDQTILNWQHYTRKRVKLIETAAAAQQQSVQGTPNSQAAQQSQQGANAKV